MYKDPATITPVARKKIKLGFAVFRNFIISSDINSNNPIATDIKRGMPTKLSIVFKLFSCKMLIKSDIYILPLKYLTVKF